MGFQALVRELGPNHLVRLVQVTQPPESPCLSGKTLGCEMSSAKPPPSSPGIKMNSYEVLPPDVDRKILLSVSPQSWGPAPRFGKERNRALVCPADPAPPPCRPRAPERCQVFPALTLYSWTRSLRRSVTPDPKRGEGCPVPAHGWQDSPTPRGQLCSPLWP